MTTGTRGGVVVGFDGSIPARLAVYWAAREAANRRVPLRLIYVMRWPLIELADLECPMRTLDGHSLYDAARMAVAVAVQHTSEVAPGIEISSDVLTGDPIEVIAEQARGAGLLVLGTSGQTGLDGVLVGASSAELARVAECPVVIVRANSRMPMHGPGRRVVVGVDGSPASTRALWFAFDFAARHDAELVAVHAWCDLPLEGLTAGLDGSIDETLVRQNARRSLTAALSEPAERYPYVRTRKVIAVDRPAKALLSESRGAELVVVGSHGRARSAHVPLGSVSHVMLHYADTSVAIIRPPAEQPR
ncbi:universal stress protein [Kibdelosporangium aridum]|uniref:Universal stress protein n=1 Tax=Kibdelosporangium aridum TaxID=2030 RepID=A0A428ZAW2_KIBAR|nr:universal stress protein [Kibdelosporangium aridum]RSM85199.1 universal stress protein [Kibdelosporangium aridum]